MRGLTDIKMIVVEESSYFDTSQIQGARETIEILGKIKSNNCTVRIPPGTRPMDPMDQIKAEPEDKCIYKRMFLSYKTGLDKIYTHKEIQLQKSMSKGMKRYCQRRKKEEEKSK